MSISRYLSPHCLGICGSRQWPAVKRRKHKFLTTMIVTIQSSLCLSCLCITAVPFIPINHSFNQVPSISLRPDTIMLIFLCVCDVKLLKERSFVISPVEIVIFHMAREEKHRSFDKKTRSTVDFTCTHACRHRTINNIHRAWRYCCYLHRSFALGNSDCDQPRVDWDIENC